MAASMFILGDIYEQGDGGAKDSAAALAWFAITGEFERQTSHNGETPLSRTAAQRAQSLKRTLTTEELERAQVLAQSEFRQIVTALTQHSPAPSNGRQPPLPKMPAPEEPAIDWPQNTADQVRVVQQALFDLKRLRDKPDGALGPMTRSAIRDFQKSVGLAETGEPSREVYAALLSTRQDVVTSSPLPTPPSSPLAVIAPPPPLESPKVETTKAAPAQVEATTAAPTKTETPKSEAPKVVETAKVEAPKVVEAARPAPPPVVETKIDLGTPPEPPAPPTSAEIAALAPPLPTPPKVDPSKPPAVVIDTSKPELPKIESAPPKFDPYAWPAGHLDQVKAIQTMLRDLRFYTKPIDGQASSATQTAIRDYQRAAGLKETGEVSKALFDSLQEVRKLMTPPSLDRAN